MFELSTGELNNWRSQFGTSNREKMGLRIPPFAFTEHGVLMLASVLRSERAVQVNIRIVRIFTKMREILVAQKDYLEKLKQIENKLADHEDSILLIFEYIKQLENVKKQQEDFHSRRKIGFNR